MEQLLNLLFLIAVFTVAGFKNGFYYSRKMDKNLMAILTIFILCGFYILTFDKIWLLFLILPPLVWQAIVFDRGINKDIHLSEYFVSFSIRAMMIICGSDILMMVLSTFLIETAFKLGINLEIGRRWIEKTDGTNDPTGKTVDFWLWGKQYHVPRVSNGYTKLYLGIAGTLLWLALYQLGITLTL